MTRIFQTSTLVIILFLFTSLTPAEADYQFEQQPEVVFISATVTLDELAAGAPGEGWLVVYRSSQRRPEDLGLIVHLSNDSSTTQALVYDFQDGLQKSQVDIQNDKVDLRGKQPTLSMVSLDGWWVKDGKVSYNLNVEVSSPVQATWGGDVIIPYLETRDKYVRIFVRDVDGDGFPDWDLRTIIPPLEGKGVLRTNYSESKCDARPSIAFGVAPLWPYIALQGTYEQPNGIIHPPIVLDLATGAIQYFSELVTARNQGCSYTLYTIDPLNTTGIFTTDFEAPFAFYNLSDSTSNYPNLILRTERHSGNSVWNKTETQEFESIRYSWRNAIGDWFWDYKVEVFGTYPYDFETPIAGGEILIDAPPYEQFPAWVTTKQWPAVTFIDTEGKSYKSSEGIYEWSPRDLDDDYLLGQEIEPAQEAFTSIREGLRGEYRVKRDIEPNLYLSPIDNRAHLLGAEQGLWNLGEHTSLIELNTNGDLYIDGWVRALSDDPQSSCAGQTLPAFCRLQEALFAGGQYLIYTNPSEVLLKPTSYVDALFTILPPTDHATWVDFVARVEPVTQNRRDPHDLRAWLDAFTGESIEIRGAQAGSVRASPGGFQFVLQLDQGAVVEGAGAAPFQGLAAGKYFVEYANGQFNVTAFRPAQLEWGGVSVDSLEGEVLVEQPLQLSLPVRNSGHEDSPALTIQARDEAGELVGEQTVIFEAGQTRRLYFTWTPREAGEHVLSFQISGQGAGESSQTVAAVSLSVSPGRFGWFSRILPVSNQATPLFLVTFWVGIAASAGILFLAIITRKGSR
ncbi:MAG: hypothetical protein VB089_02530 [Anaerolineaceae bacterium]|nr:hypothetical protein [Anaerolineaceae bacterium]